MAGSADLSDPGVIRAFRASLARFQQRVESALDGAPAQLGKTQEMLRLELGPYWKKELSRRQEAYSEARRRWLEAEEDVRANGRRGAIDKASTADERREMNKALRRCEEAEGKLAEVKTWLARLDGDGKDLLARVRDHQLTLHDLSRGAVIKLDQMATLVDEYLQRPGGT
jgi:hypothetical protein